MFKTSLWVEFVYLIVEFTIFLSILWKEG